MPSNLQPILFLVAIAAVFYLLMIRPQQKKRKETQAMLQSLKPGSEIVTTAGMYGKVVSLEGDDALLLEVAPGVTCKYMRQAVMRVVPDATAAAPEQESLPESKDGAADDSTKDTAAEEATTDVDDGKSEADSTVEAVDGTDPKKDADSSDGSGAANGDRRSSS